MQFDTSPAGAQGLPPPVPTREGVKGLLAAIHPVVSAGARTAIAALLDSDIIELRRLPGYATVFVRVPEGVWLSIPDFIDRWLPRVLGSPVACERQDERRHHKERAS